MTPSVLLDHRPGELRRVTSAANEVVKAIRALEQKKHREESGLFIAEGARTVIEALELGAEIAAVAYLEAAGGEAHVARIAEAVARRGGLVLQVNREVLEKISRRDNAQTVIGVFRQRWSALADLPAAPRMLVLEEVRDPGNLGTVIRAADALGVGALVLVGDCTDPYGLDAVRASMGSIFAMPVAKAGREAFLAWRRGVDARMVGMHLKGAVDVREVAWGARSLVVMGGEQRGLTAELAEACDVLVRIPMAGRADSLNLAIATGITLFESVRGGA